MPGLFLGVALFPSSFLLLNSYFLLFGKARHGRDVDPVFNQRCGEQVSKIVVSSPGSGQLPARQARLPARWSACRSSRRGLSFRQHEGRGVFRWLWLRPHSSTSCAGFPYLLATDRHPEVISSVPMHVEICNIRFAPRLALACRGLHMFSVVPPDDVESGCESVNSNRSFYSGNASLAQW